MFTGYTLGFMLSLSRDNQNLLIMIQVDHRSIIYVSILEPLPTDNPALILPSALIFPQHSAQHIRTLRLRLEP